MNGASPPLINASIEPFASPQFAFLIIAPATSNVQAQSFSTIISLTIYSQLFQSVIVTLNVPAVRLVNTGAVEPSDQL